jgi:aminoglycoside 3-N-acetyltransferase I
MTYSIHQLTCESVTLMPSLLTMFGQAFNDVDTYESQQPDETYFRHLLASDYFIAIAALESGEVIGGLAAYELKKFEQQRSEIYIYDLAVAENHRRKGIATELIDKLKKIAANRGAYVIFVQADLEDTPAINLYTKLGRREDVLHFDIDVLAKNGQAEL